MALADTYTVSGTGTSYDGVYAVYGSTLSNGISVFRLDATHFLYIFRDGSAFRWELNSSIIPDDMASNVPYYDSSSSTHADTVPNPDVGTWNVGTGSGSAPSVDAGGLVITNRPRGAALFF